MKLLSRCANGRRASARARKRLRRKRRNPNEQRVCPAFLVPKLRLGTHLRAQLCCVGSAVGCGRRKELHNHFSTRNPLPPCEAELRSQAEFGNEGRRGEVSDVVVCASSFSPRAMKKHLLTAIQILVTVGILAWVFHDREK